MKLQRVYKENLSLTEAQLMTNVELLTHIQVVLIGLRLLVPPTDGKLGTNTRKALELFRKNQGILATPFFSGAFAEKLIEAKPPAKPLDLASRIVAYMVKKGYQVFRGEGEVNIVYLEGCSAEGVPNSDSFNAWNDRRITLVFKGDRPVITGNWSCTTEPGDRYTYRPMNPLGAARIAFGQFRAWVFGMHGTVFRHEALVQVGNITVHRDLNKDGARVGDKVYTGSDMGINQHSTSNAPETIGAWSAGCLVGRHLGEHKVFLNVLRTDPRYKANKGFVFTATIIDSTTL